MKRMDIVVFRSALIKSYDSSVIKEKDDETFEFKEWIIDRETEMTIIFEKFKKVVETYATNFRADKKKYEDDNKLKPVAMKSLQVPFMKILQEVVINKNEDYQAFLILTEEKYKKDFESVDKYLEQEYFDKEESKKKEDGNKSSFQEKITKLKKVDIPRSINIDLLKLIKKYNLVDKG